LVIPIVVAFQVPVPIVPSVVILAEPAQVDRAVFSTLFSARIVLVVAALRTSGDPVPAVLRPRIDAEAMFANFVSVTAPAAIVAEIAVVPDPDKSPLSVMLWFAVRYALVSHDKTPEPLLRSMPDALAGYVAVAQAVNPETAAALRVCHDLSPRQY
jgi:hypothetical protein